MTTKLLTMSELSKVTYGKFSRSGVRVELNQFFQTEAGKKAISDLRVEAKKPSGHYEPTIRKQKK